MGGFGSTFVGTFSECSKNSRRKFSWRGVGVLVPITISRYSHLNRSSRWNILTIVRTWSTRFHTCYYNIVLILGYSMKKREFAIVAMQWL
jgi:hypothetical protein